MEGFLEKMIEFIKGVEDGAEYSTTEILKELGINYDEADTYDLFELDYQLKKEVRKNKIKLDSSAFEGMVVGLPYNIPFVINKKKEWYYVKRYLWWFIRLNGDGNLDALEQGLEFMLLDELTSDDEYDDLDDFDD